MRLFQRLRNPRRLTIAACLALTGWSAPAVAQTATAVRPTGSVSFYSSVSTLSADGGASTTFGEFITAARLMMADGEGQGVEYGIDFRQARYSQADRDPRLSIYDGFVGARVAGGRVRVRAGQMWITDLGGLGSVAGGLVEYRQPQRRSGFGRLSFGGFMGVEPTPYSVGRVDGVSKFGVYTVTEGDAGRRHTLGYIRLDHSGLVERSVVSFSNFIPAKSRFFVYQAGEYDLTGPAGQGTGGLTYFMINGRAMASSRVELQGLYHRGRSIDSRTITEDLLAGRPVPAGALDGYLFESIGGRLTVQVGRTARVYGGYSQDRNNRESDATGRLTLGASTTNLARSGVDLTVTQSRFDRPGGQYDSTYISVGRQIARMLYLSGDYSSSVSVVQFTTSDGLTVEMRPHTTQISMSGVMNVGRHVSILNIFERTNDDSSGQWRLLSGLTYRF